MTTGERPSVAIVGGGITGLATAWFLRATGDVTVFEAAGRLGGKILTTELGGRPVDEGPDAFITRTPDAVDLAGELGLADELVAPTTGHASLWTRGRLRPLPPNVLGVPADLMALARSGILPAHAVARAALDLVLPTSDFAGDRAVAEVIGARLGRGAAVGMVDALLGGIHAGHTDDLSIDAVAPQIAAVARSNRSLIRGLQATRAAAAKLGTAGSPVFLSPRGGVGRLVDRLAAELGEQVRYERVQRLERAERGGWLVDGRPFDAVVLAVPAPVAAGLIGVVSPRAGAELRAFRHSSVIVVTLAYPTDALPADRYQGSGFLVPRPEGRLMTACTFGSNKWPHWSGADTRVVRISTGRTRDERAFDLSDDRLIDALHDELAQAVGVTGRPVEARVSRWPDAFAQYEPGHLRRVERIETALAQDMPGVVVAGATYRGSRHPGLHCVSPPVGRGCVTIAINVGHVPRVTVTQLPQHLRPMLTTTGELPRKEEAYTFEVKWDGVRGVSYLDGGSIHMESRNLLDITPRYPELATLPESLSTRAAVLDGEVVAFGEDGRPSFGRLQSRMHVAAASEVRRRMVDTPVVYLVFDILWLDGRSLVDLVWTERRAILDDLDIGSGAGRWRVPASHMGEGTGLLEATKANGLEGVIAKRMDSTYEPGKRSRAWVKVKNVNRQEMVIGGWLPGEGNRTDRLGALLVGYYDDGGALHYAGRVGSGFTDAELARVSKLLAALSQSQSPFVEKVPVPPRLPRFVRPELVCDVEFGEWTQLGTLRHPRYKGLRDDKAPSEVRREPVL